MAHQGYSLFNKLTFLQRGEEFNEHWSEASRRPRAWEDMYRNRWQHDRIIRSTHGVNCTGSCSWQIFVKDGIITWEGQQTDYPTTGSNFPEYEPRGCPRGASYSWYTYSPMRVKYPYIRQDLLRLWRSELKSVGNPVTAWTNIVTDEKKRELYQSARGKGGLVRTTWDEITEIIAAACIDTIKRYGPDRVTGFSPIPAMSMVSYAAGTRFLSLIGGTILSFYDWYADLPPASPQIWGEQTDVPESADWYNSKYFIIWGTNLPMTRTPDAHFMVESRYNGTKVVGVAPDYAEYVKFADIWLPAHAGTDAALAMSMTHVVLKEFYFDKQEPYFTDYVKRYTDLPFLITLRQTKDSYTPNRFLTASDLGANEKNAEWKPVMWDDVLDKPIVPIGSVGYRWDDSKQWNLKLQTQDGQAIEPRLTFYDDGTSEPLVVEFPFLGGEEPGVLRRGVPVRRIPGENGTELLVVTVLDLMMAHAGVQRGLPGDYPKDYDDDKPYTPAWQERITGVDRSLAIQVAREFADNAARTKGRSMIAMGAGTNHWYHSDLIYRCILNLVLLCGCEGVNGGGWAHYVGQEKVRPLPGWATLAFATDWVRPPRQMQGTSFFYFATDQYRYEDLDTATLGSPLSRKYHEMHPADFNALAARLGWMPAFPQFRQNSLKLVQEAKASGCGTDQEIIDHVVSRVKSGEIEWSIEDPDNPDNFPRVMFLWRSNLLGSSGKGHEYFLKHLLGAQGHVLADADNAWKPEHIRVPDEVPQGKLDLLVDSDFRMTSSGLYADIVLPTATWYEKYDVSSTDMHPFIHPFNAAISNPWETRSDWDTFRTIAQTFSRLAKDHLPAQDDVVMAPLSHDTADEIAQPFGQVKDWRNGETEAVPGKTMPKFSLVKRDYPNVDEQMTTLGPLAEQNIKAKGITISGKEAYEEMLARVGPSRSKGVGHGRPSLWTDKQAVEAVLTLSGATNGRRAMAEWKYLSSVTGLENVKEIAQGREEEAYTLLDITAQPRVSLPTAVWSGIEKDGRRYSPFTVNIDYEVPFRTLTGRQHFYLDHEVMLDYGEALPQYRPPLILSPFQTQDPKVEEVGKSITVRYLTPHQKWGFHSVYFDNQHMLTLFRGGQTVWINEKDAEKIGVHDNDWIELFNRNGVVAARAVVTFRIPEGVAMMYHAQDRTMSVPGTQITGDRGGTHNSATRVIMKPTHMIGGYGQFSYDFNYYGPTGHQRDALAVIRPLKELNWLES